MKYLSVLGSTGSIGRNTLEVIERFPDRYSVKALAAKYSVDSLASQVKRLHPEMVAVFDETAAGKLQEMIPDHPDVKIMHGPEGYEAAATLPGVDMVLGAFVGAAGLMPTLQAINAGKDIALANKETLVMAGSLVMERVRKNNVRLVPVDSEHSAIFQCLSGQRKADLEKILLTASGGPFRDRAKENMAGIRPQDALNHPTWSMGKKISIDSATLMNKGLEVIEAKWLFDVPAENIEVVVHPQSIVHSMVAYRDGSVLAQLGVPDMKGAIAYALSFPERLPLDQPCPDFAKLGALTFQPPDIERFPCLSLAFHACNTGGTLPAVMNAANEIAVDAFLNEWIPFSAIPELIEQTMDSHELIRKPELEAILDADQWARAYAMDRLSTYR